VSPEALEEHGELTKQYIPVLSLNQQNLAPQEQTDPTTKTQLKSATGAQFRTAYKAFVTRDPHGVNPSVFLILDQQSIDNVIAITPGLAQWFTPEDELADDSMAERKDLVQK
jgi:hypothetical protein